MNKILKDIILGIIIIAVTIILTFVLRSCFFTFDKKLNTEQKEKIEKYILEVNNSYLEEGMTFASTYYFGSRYNDNKLKVYLWVIFSEYDTSSENFEQYQSFSMPYVVTIDVENDNFKIINHDIPKDGSLYKESIKQLFPITIRNNIKLFDNSSNFDKLIKEHNKMIETYKKYFEGDE